MNTANFISIFKAAGRSEARWTGARHNFMGCTAAVFVRLKAVAPYALIELVLPGGSVMALLLWLYRQRKDGVSVGDLRGRLLSFFRLTNPLRFSAAART